MNKEKIIVSAEVKTYLIDLYNQIEYELRDDYKDSLEKTTKALLDIKEYINENKIYGVDEDGYDDAWYDKVEVREILEIINKALEDKDE